MGADRRTNEVWSIPDVLMAGLTAMCLLASWGVFRFVVPEFGSMYAEFGGELPASTRIVLSSTGRMAVPGAYTGAVVLAFLLRRFYGISVGRIALLLSLLVGVGLLATTMALLYMPLWSISGQVQ